MTGVYCSHNTATHGKATGHSRLLCLATGFCYPTDGGIQDWMTDSHFFLVDTKKQHETR